MIDKKEFKKMAKKILKSDRGVQNPKLMHPAREWGIGVILGFLILAASAAWSASTYISYRSSSNISSSDVDSEVVVYRALQVETALKTFAERSVRYEELVGGTSEVNPSQEEVEFPLVDEITASSSEDILLEEGGLETELATEPGQANESVEAVEEPIDSNPSIPGVGGGFPQAN